MEEKERYGITDAHYLCDSAIFDTKNNDILRLYQICDLLNEQSKRIKELEEKLAESEKKIEELNNDIYYNMTCMKESRSNYEKKIDNMFKENIKLKQELAEKEKEIETLNKFLSDKADEIEKITCDYKRQLSASNILTQAMKIREHNQDKISFAIEQLEKVKKDIEIKVESIYKRLDDLKINIVCESTSSQLSTYEEIVKDIDNQINELKEMK